MLVNLIKNLSLPSLNSLNNLINRHIHLNNHLIKSFSTTKSKQVFKSSQILSSSILGNKKSKTCSESSDNNLKLNQSMSNIVLNKSSIDIFEDFEPEYGYHDDYEILNRLGSGKYSQVYSGLNIVSDKEVIIKVLKPVNKKKIRREIGILTLLKGHENIVSLIDVIVDPSSRTPSFIFEKINHIDFKTLFPKFTQFDIKLYLYNILKGLIFCHSNGVIHRDIKPHNIIIDPKLNIIKLIDFGLAEVYKENTEYSCRVASRYFKSPELLLEYTKYDYSLDIWSTGCIFAGLIFKKEPFFHGSDNTDQLIKIVKVFGTEELIEYVNKYSLTLIEDYKESIEGHKKKDWRKFITHENEELCTDDALDLIESMLKFDHSKRITAENAIKHVYFNEIREFYKEK